MDIVKRLRKKLFMQYESETTAIADEATDEIERLREERDDYKKTLERIALYDIQCWDHQVLIRHAEMAARNERGE